MADEYDWALPSVSEGITFYTDNPTVDQSSWDNLGALQAVSDYLNYVPADVVQEQSVALVDLLNQAGGGQQFSPEVLAAFSAAPLAMGSGASGFLSSADYPQQPAAQEHTGGGNRAEEGPVVTTIPNTNLQMVKLPNGQYAVVTATQQKQETNPWLKYGLAALGGLGAVMDANSRNKAVRQAAAQNQIAMQQAQQNQAAFDARRNRPMVYGTPGLTSFSGAR